MIRSLFSALVVCVAAVSAQAYTEVGEYKLQVHGGPAYCAESAINAALAKGIALDSSRVGTGEVINPHSENRPEGYLYWLPVVGVNPGCYIVRTSLNCRFESANMRHSTWYAGCPIFSNAR